MAGITNPLDLARTIEGPTLPPVSTPARQRDTREYKTAEQLTVGDVKHLMLPENSALIVVPGVSEILDAHTDDAAQGREVLQQICLRVANMQQGVAHEIEKRVVRGERYPLAVDVDKCDDEGYPIAKEKFVKAKELASGGMGEVWVGSMQEVKEPVAAKFLTTQNKTQVARFQREIMLQSKLGGEDSPKLLGVAMDQNPPYFVMEYRPGHDLRQLLSERDENSWPAPEVPLIISLRLANIHGKLRAHRDLKPANIWISDKGEVWILDYGLASAEGSGPDLTESGVAAGTVAYMSPEQVWGMKRLTGESDVYSLACILYEMYTGKKLHPDELTDRIAVPKEYCPDLSSIQKRDPALAELFVRMFDAEPHRRPSAAEVSEFFFEKSSKRETSKDWKEFSKKKEQHRLSTASVAYAPDNIPVPSSVQPKGKYQSISVHIDDGDSSVPQPSLKAVSPSALAKLSRSVLVRALAGVAAVGGAVGGVYYTTRNAKDPQKAEAPLVPSVPASEIQDNKPIETSIVSNQAIENVKPIERPVESSISVEPTKPAEVPEWNAEKKLVHIQELLNSLKIAREFEQGDLLPGVTVSGSNGSIFEGAAITPSGLTKLLEPDENGLPPSLASSNPYMLFLRKGDGPLCLHIVNVGYFLRAANGQVLFYPTKITSAKRENDTTYFIDGAFEGSLGSDVELGGTYNDLFLHPDFQTLVRDARRPFTKAETLPETEALYTFKGVKKDWVASANMTVANWANNLPKTQSVRKSSPSLTQNKATLNIDSQERRNLETITTPGSAAQSPAPVLDVQRAVQEKGAVALQK